VKLNHTRRNKDAAQSVLKFYYLTIRLKNLIRTGWKQWNVDKERLESVAEHVFGTCMVAIGMASEYEYDIDISKVIMMLVVHEMEEIIISDITPFQGISAEEKLERGHQAVEEIFSELNEGETYKELIYEFDARESQEAKYAYRCDKLDAVLMSLYYDKTNEYTLAKASRQLQQNEATIQLSENGQYAMGECFYLYECKLDRLDENFDEVLEAAWQEHQREIQKLD